MGDETAVRSSWLMPDSCSSLCFECGVSFSPFTRRHHCAQCGFVFCRSCCSTFLDGTAVHLQAGSRVRLCRGCAELQHMHSFVALPQQQQQPQRRLEPQLQSQKVLHQHFQPPQQQQPQKLLHQQLPSQHQQQNLQQEQQVQPHTSQQQNWRQHRELLEDQGTGQSAEPIHQQPGHVLTRFQELDSLHARTNRSAASSPCSPLLGTGAFWGQQNTAAAAAETGTIETNLLLPGSSASVSATLTDCHSMRASSTVGVAPSGRTVPRSGAPAAASARSYADVCQPSETCVVRCIDTSTPFRGGSSSRLPPTTVCAEHPMQHLRNTSNTHQQETTTAEYASGAARRSPAASVSSATMGAARTECAAVADSAAALPAESLAAAVNTTPPTAAIRADSTLLVTARDEVHKFCCRRCSSIFCPTSHIQSADVISSAARGELHVPSCCSSMYALDPLWFNCSLHHSQQQQHSSRHCLKQRHHLQQNNTSQDQQKERQHLHEVDLPSEGVPSEQRSRCQQQTRTWPSCQRSSMSAEPYRTLPAPDETASLNFPVSRSIPLSGARTVVTSSGDISMSAEVSFPPYASLAAAAAAPTRALPISSPFCGCMSAMPLERLSFAASPKGAAAKRCGNLETGRPDCAPTLSAVAASTAAAPCAAVSDASAAALSCGALSSPHHVASGRFCCAADSACAPCSSAEAAADGAAAVREREQGEATSLPLLIPLGSAAERASHFLLESMRLHCLLVGLSPSLHAELLFLLAVTVVRPLRLPRRPLRQHTSRLRSSWNSRAAPLASSNSSSTCLNPFASFSPHFASANSLSSAAARTGSQNIFDSVKIKRMYGGCITDSFYVHGIVFPTGITQKSLKQLRLERPRIILLSFYLGLTRDRPETLRSAAGGDPSRPEGSENSIISTSGSTVKYAMSLSKVTRSLTRTSWGLIDKASSLFTWFLRCAVSRYDAHLGMDSGAAAAVPVCPPLAAPASSCPPGSARGTTTPTAAAYPKANDALPDGILRCFGTERKESAAVPELRTPALLTAGATSAFSTASAMCQHVYPEAGDNVGVARAARLNSAGRSHGVVRFVRLQVLREQEAKHASILVSKIRTLQPDLIVSSSGASFLLQQRLKELNIAFLPNVPVRTLRRISRYTGAPILPSLDLAAAAVAAGAATAWRCPPSASAGIAISNAVDPLAGAPRSVGVPAAATEPNAAEPSTVKGPAAPPPEEGSTVPSDSRSLFSADGASPVTPTWQEPVPPWGWCGLFALCPFLPLTASSADRPPSIWGIRGAGCCVKPMSACINKAPGVGTGIDPVHSRAARGEDELLEDAAAKDSVQPKARLDEPVTASRVLAFFVGCRPSRGATICLRGGGGDLETEIDTSCNLQTPHNADLLLGNHTGTPGTRRNTQQHMVHPHHPRFRELQDFQQQERSQQCGMQRQLYEKVPQQQLEQETLGQQNPERSDQLQPPEPQYRQGRVEYAMDSKYKATAPASCTLFARVDELLLAKRVLRRGLLVALSLQQELRFVAASCPSRGPEGCRKYTSAACTVSETFEKSSVPIPPGSPAEELDDAPAEAPSSRAAEDTSVNAAATPRKAAQDSWYLVEPDWFGKTPETSSERDAKRYVRHTEDVSSGPRTGIDASAAYSKASYGAGRCLVVENCTQELSAPHNTEVSQRSCESTGSGCCCSCTFSTREHCCSGSRFTCSCCCHFVSRPHFAQCRRSIYTLPLPRVDFGAGAVVRASSSSGATSDSTAPAGAGIHNAVRSAEAGASTDSRSLLRGGGHPRRNRRQRRSSAHLFLPWTTAATGKEVSAADTPAANHISPELTLQALLQETYLCERLRDWARCALSSATVKPSVLLLAYRLLTSVIPPCAADPLGMEQNPVGVGGTAASLPSPALCCGQTEPALFLSQQRLPFCAHIHKQQPQLEQAVGGRRPPPHPQELRKEDSLPKERFVLQTSTPLASNERQQQQLPRQVVDVRQRRSRTDCVALVRTHERVTASPNELSGVLEARRPFSSAEDPQPEKRNICEKSAVLHYLSEIERLLRGDGDTRWAGQLDEPSKCDIAYVWNSATAGEATGGQSLGFCTHESWRSALLTKRFDGGSLASHFPSSSGTRPALFAPVAAGCGAADVFTEKIASAFGAAAPLAVAAASAVVAATGLTAVVALQARISPTSFSTTSSFLQARARAAAAVFGASAATARPLAEKAREHQTVKEARSPARLRSRSPEGLLAEIYAAENTAASAAASVAFSMPSAATCGPAGPTARSYPATSGSTVNPPASIGLSPCARVDDVGAAHSGALSTPLCQSGSAGGCESMGATPVETATGTLPPHVRRQLKGLLPQLLVGLYRPSAQRLQLLSSWSFNKQQCDAPPQQHELLLLQPPPQAGDTTSGFAVEELRVAYSRTKSTTFPVFPFSTAPLDYLLHPSASFVRAGSSAMSSSRSSAWTTDGANPERRACAWAQPQLRQVTGNLQHAAFQQDLLRRQQRQTFGGQKNHEDLQGSALLTAEPSPPAAGGAGTTALSELFYFPSVTAFSIGTMETLRDAVLLRCDAAAAVASNRKCPAGSSRCRGFLFEHSLRLESLEARVVVSFSLVRETD